MPGPVISARIVRVVDGDTVLVKTVGPHKGLLPDPGRTRLIGLNAPDLGEYGGDDARRFVAAALPIGRLVHLQLGRVQKDDGGRWLVYMWTSAARSLNLDLLERGYASLQLKENPQMSGQFSAAELRAKQRGIGLWRECPTRHG
jgi:endonuclease YncB( thermonuclease family)